MRFDNSLKIYKEALQVIPMGVSTFSKNPNLFVIGASPLFIKSAKGCRLIDVDGNEFIDYSMALGPIILGYANPQVDKAAKEAIDEGLIYTLSCPEESRLAKKIIEIIPCAEMVRFSKNGSDVCEAAVRLARHFTKKTKIISVGGYHGFHDWFIASTPRNYGIPEVLAEWVIAHSFNDIDTLEKTITTRHQEIAALILEPVINHKPEEGFLQRIRELTKKHNIVLIFDEMKTGFRLDLGGAQKYFNVTPDLAVFAKGVANGYPISVLAGKRELMKQFEDERCFFSASYATEKASINAALKTIEILENKKVFEHIWTMGGLLKAGVEKIIKQHALGNTLDIVGFEPMTHFIISSQGDNSVNEIKSFIQQECVRRGVLFVGYHHTCWAHARKDIAQTLAVYDEAFVLLKKALATGSLKKKLEGKPIGAFGLRG